ncbi:MAG: hypothetical protein ACRCUS_05565 [Anaerovoracaceae bacterium]
MQKEQKKNSTADEMTTSRLEKRIKSICGDNEIKYFIQEFEKKKYDYFYEYLRDYMKNTEIELQEVISKSGISSNYAYNIINGDRKKPGRDKIIALCIATGMSFEETNRGLKIAKEGILYVKDERDARIAIALNNGVSKVIDLNIKLEGHGLEPLAV